MTIATYAHVHDLVTRSEFTSTSEDYKYKVSLYKDGLVDTFVGSYTGYADGNRAGKSLNTTKGSKYYFVISAVNENLSMTPYSIEGTGSVDHVTVD